MRPAALVEDEVTDSAVRRLINYAEEELEPLMILSRADLTTKNPEKKRHFLECYDIVESKFADLANLGITYIRCDIPEGSEKLFLKEALWNIGALATKSSRLVFLDSDIVFVSREWVSAVSMPPMSRKLGTPCRMLFPIICETVSFRFLW